MDHPEPSLPPSALARALAAFRADPSDAARAACLTALVDAVVYLASPPLGAQATGREPTFRLAPSTDRTLLVCETDLVEAAVWAFADRASAEAFCARAPGWLAEPVPGPVVAHLAAGAGCQLVLDPIGAALVIDRQMMAWGVCPRRPPARPAFADAFASWLADRQPWTHAPLAAALADAVFYLLEAEAPPGPDERVPVATAVGRTLVLEDLDGALYLTASTDRATVASWCEGTVCRPMAVDGAGLLALGTGLGVEVGLLIGADRALAIGPDEPEWPRRDLSASDS